MSFIEINNEVLFSSDLKQHMENYVNIKRKEGYSVEISATTRGWKVSSKFAINSINDLKPDIRFKIEEYISELDQEINRCVFWVEENMSGEAYKVAAMESRIETLTEIKNDLQSRMEEII